MFDPNDYEYTWFERLLDFLEYGPIPWVILALCMMIICTVFGAK